MNTTVEQNLVFNIRRLSPQQVAEVEDFVDFLAAKPKKRAAIDTLLGHRAGPRSHGRSADE